jgi:hypothetical protein
MTESEMYAYIKKKVSEGIEADAKIERQKQEELEDIAKTTSFLENFYDEHNEKMKQFKLIPDHWLGMAHDNLWRKKECWEMRQIWAERDYQIRWLLNFREGKHTTGPLTFSKIAEENSCTLKEVKKYLESLEKDGWLGKMKYNGFFPYWWYLIEEEK